ncbi:outer membrane protein [Sphingorhabdus rigui]|uniref:Outer membrane protein n=1 Tax=Sphingorhabdus rigui TaxID=1282858 RepID=A0A840B0H8_9SPHN|nr:TolC family protein [Sphingorhabdus rigui]MBB3942717.1 outer membrane protein [Sphingorhabdus rigui]
MVKRVAFAAARAMLAASATLVLANAHAVHAETLMDVVQSAQENDPEYRAARFQNQADAEATRQAWARFKPQVRASAATNLTRQEIISSDNSVYDIGKNSYPDYGYEVRIDQSLFDFQNWAGLRAARTLRRQSSAQFEVAKQDLLLRVVERYFTLLAAQEAASAARAEVRAIDAHVKLVSSKYARGAVRYAELLDVQARYQMVLAKQIQTESGIRDAAIAIKEVTGVYPGSLDDLSDAMTVATVTPDEPQHWVDLAVQNNPRIIAAAHAARRGDQLIAVEKAAGYPTLNLQMFHDRRKTEGSLFGGGSDISQLGARVRLDVPISAGGQVRSRVNEARALYEKAVAESVRTSRGVERQTLLSIDSINTAAARVGALKASLDAQEKVVQQLNAAFRAGVSASVDYLDSERDLFQARAEYLRARYDFALNTVRLRHALGLLSIDDIAELSGKMAPVAPSDGG